MNKTSPAYVLSYLRPCFLKLEQSLGCTWSPLSLLQWSQLHILDTLNPLSTKTIKVLKLIQYLRRATCVEKSNSFEMCTVQNTSFCFKSASADYQMEFQSVLKVWTPPRQLSVTIALERETKLQMGWLTSPTSSYWQHQRNQKQFSGSLVLCGGQFI